MLGFAFLLPSIDPVTAVYLSTGTPTLELITIGMALAPNLVAESKAEGTFEYNRALPVPRTAVIAADVTIWPAIGLPGMVLRDSLTGAVPGVTPYAVLAVWGVAGLMVTLRVMTRRN